MRRLIKLLKRKQLPYKIVKLDDISTGTVRRMRAHVVASADHATEYGAMLLDVVDIIRGRTAGVCWVFLYNRVEDVGIGLPEARAQFVKHGLPQGDIPMGLVGPNRTEVIDIDGGTVTLAL